MAGPSALEAGPRPADPAEVAAAHRMTPPMSQTLYDLLVLRHEELAAGEESPEPLAGDKLGVVRESLATKLMHPVWAPDLTKAGFRFRSASVFAVNGVNAVAVTYTRGTQSVSAMSVPVRTVVPVVAVCRGRRRRADGHGQGDGTDGQADAVAHR